MSLQEVQQSDTRRDGDGNMLIKNEQRSQPALDDFKNESASTRMKESSLPDKLYQTDELYQQDLYQQWPSG